MDYNTRKISEYFTMWEQFFYSFKYIHRNPKSRIKNTSFGYKKWNRIFERGKYYQKQSIERMCNYYIKRLLAVQLQININLITKEMIIFKRKCLTIKRIIKSKQQINNTGGA